MTVLKNWAVILGAIGSIASIAGLFLFCFSSTISIIIALSYFCVCLTIILTAILFILFSFIKGSHKFPYEKISAFTKYETSDGVHITNETYRVIQVKRILLTEVEQNFKWTGSKRPEITSGLQTTSPPVFNDKNTYDKVTLKLKKPMMFNETGVLHFHARMDDVDGVAEPFLSFRVDMPINIIHYTIILKYKPDNYDIPAKLLRMKIDSDLSPRYETMLSIPFDNDSKSYEYHLISPEVGYFYRIEWEK